MEAPTHRNLSFFFERRARQENNRAHACPSLFDTQKTGAVNNSVLTQTRDYKRRCENKDACCVGVMQTSRDTVDSAQLLIVNWCYFQYNFCTTF